MGIVIRFPNAVQDARVNYYGLELFVESCGELLNTLSPEKRLTAKQEFNRLVEELVQFIDECNETRRSE